MQSFWDLEFFERSSVWFCHRIIRANILLYKMSKCSGHLTYRVCSHPFVCEVCRQERLAQEAQVPLEYGQSPIWIKEGPPYGTAATSTQPEVVAMEQDEDRDEDADAAMARALQAEENEGLAGEALEVMDELRGRQNGKKPKLEEPDEDYKPPAVSSEEQPTKLLRSSRRAASRSCKRQGISFRMSSSDTLMTLKLKILEKSHLSPKSQHLYLGDRELIGDSMTLGALQVPPSSTLQLRVDFGGDVVPTGNSTSASVEEGFKGTALHGSNWSSSATQDRTKPSTTSEAKRASNSEGILDAQPSSKEPKLAVVQVDDDIESSQEF
eukprot:TRINITY_DN11111_c0_g4_i3.p2 TRINITY_DN11111_c0_g4~~TRINITY_DN11111_c0_g4_i3.p2  ORF type:complete len:324 (+),score=71.36 TRINITY_DN11111_c0_g4_i3:2306-3277(+)